MEVKHLFISRLVDKHGASLVRFLTKRLRNRHDAADIAQDAYLKLFSLQHPEQLENARAFLFQTASNMAVDQLRRKHLHNRYLHAEMSYHLPQEERGPTTEHSTPSAEQRVTDEQQLQLVYQAISELPPHCREAFLLQRNQGMTYSQIAKQLNVSTSAVEKYISQALKHCHRKLLKNNREL